MAVKEEEKLIDFVVEGEEQNKKSAETFSEDDEDKKKQQIDTLDENDDDDDEQDDEDSTARVDEDEEKKERRRQERKQREERRKQARERTEKEVKFLRKMNDNLERRLVEVERSGRQNAISSLDQQIAEETRRVNTMERVLKKAIEAKNGEDTVSAMKHRDAAKTRLAQLQNAKTRLSSESQSGHQDQQQNQPNPEMVRQARQFMSDHPWYKVDGSDEDSAIVMALDSSLSRTMDPSTPEYWEELSKRVKARLPERFPNENNNSRTSRGGPPVAGKEQGSRTPSGKAFVLSAARKEAMIEAGVWDDPKLRDQYIRKYREYDELAKQR